MVIEAQKTWESLDLAELWQHRELLYFLIWRDVKVRYKQTALGAAWAIVQPLATMLVFTLFFSKFAGISSDGIPYPLFAYSGLMLWTFFSNSIVNGTNSLISSSNLITKVYFPRMFVPAASIGAGLLDLAVALAILFALLIVTGVGFAATLLLLPLFVLLMTVLSLAATLLISSLTVKYRDIRSILPFAIQLLMFASPIIYPASIVPERWRWLMSLNPLSGILENFRAATAGRPLNWPTLAAASLVSVVLLVFSAYNFRRLEQNFADLV